MRKLIDAETLKEYFQQQLKDTLKVLKTDEIRQLAVDIMEGIINDIDAQPPANDWIPVKTRKPTEDEQKELAVDGEYNVEWMWDCVLPDDGQEVLVTTRYGSVEKVSFYNEYPYGSYFEGYEDDGDMTAWQPLPEPYKVESEVEE